MTAQRAQAAVQSSWRSAFAAGCPVVALLRRPPPLAAATRARLAAVALSPAPSNCRDESLLARALAAHLLDASGAAAPDELELVRQPRGKPLTTWVDRRAAPAPAISLAHSDCTIAAAICAHGRLGIDVEPARAVPARLVARFFHPHDAAHLHDLPAAAQPLAFARLWTVAEACAKVSGRGLEQLHQGIDEIGHGDDGALGEIRWSVARPRPGEACAIAADRAHVLGSLTQLRWLSLRTLLAPVA